MGAGAGGRNDPNNVMHMWINEFKKKKKILQSEKKDKHLQKQQYINTSYTIV
jgi:hypothetical protein